jgi:hypothetical protein
MSIDETLRECISSQNCNLNLMLTELKIQKGSKSETELELIVIAKLRKIYSSMKQDAACNSDSFKNINLSPFLEQFFSHFN